jgi:hypothetical protein
LRNPYSNSPMFAYLQILFREAFRKKIYKLGLILWHSNPDQSIHQGNLCSSNENSGMSFQWQNNNMQKPVGLMLDRLLLSSRK